jgi:hypothetical protein
MANSNGDIEETLESEPEIDDSEGWQRKQTHGTNAQFLIEKILRERIYESLYWKEKCFGLNAEKFVDEAEDLVAIGFW